MLRSFTLEIFVVYDSQRTYEKKSYQACLSIVRGQVILLSEALFLRLDLSRGTNFEPGIRRTRNILSESSSSRTIFQYTIVG